MRAPDFWQRRGLAARALSHLGTLYSASVALKAAFAKPYRAPVPVICVGNLTAGGSGKTPVAIALAHQLAARRPFFLTRGYGGRLKGPVRVRDGQDAALVGDEALLLACTAPTVVARDRAEGAALAVNEGAGLIIMDDGHQNFSLAKTLSIVVVDGESGFGNGFAIPAGPLREPVTQGLRRADAVIVMGDGTPDLAGFRGPVLRARLVPDAHALAGRDVLAFAGIGRPQKFFTALAAAGAIVKDVQAFADHHPYSAAEIAELRTRAGSALLITTEKDLVRLPMEARHGIATLGVHAVFDAPQMLDALLAGIAP